MASLDIAPQSYYFASTKWNKEMDDLLVVVLSLYKEKYGWKKGYVPHTTLHNVRFAINKHYGSNLTTTDVFERTNFLDTRYNVFKLVARTSGTIWDIEEHQVVASDDVWTYLIKKNDFAKAYYYEDEPIFKKLAYLFGDDDDSIKIEEENNVIIINSSSSNDDEVVSPPLRIPTSIDANNTTGTSRRALNFACGSRRVKGNKSKATKNLTSSSCASSSPFK